MKEKFLLLFLVFVSNCGFAQPYQPIHHYTTETGLPSNMVYEMQQDTLGNLWLATNNGVSRFDGKYFRNYTYKDGLPSHDVVAMRVDVYGMLWLNCFGHKPTYFENDAFQVMKDSNIKNKNYILNTTSNNEALYALGGSLKAFIMQKNKTVNTVDTIALGQHVLLLKEPINSIFKLLYRNNVTDSLPIKAFFNSGSLCLDRGNMYFQNTNAVTEIGYNQYFKFVVNQYVASASITKASFSSQYILLVDDKAMVYVYDRNTKKLITKLQTPKGAKCAYLDNYQQLWIGTHSDGLYCYAPTHISNYINNTNHNQMLSVYANQKGQLFAGNQNFELHEFTNNHHTLTAYPIVNRGGALKNIVPQGKHIFVVEDNAIFKLYSTERLCFTYKFRSITPNPLQLKCGLSINDSTLFVGAMFGGCYINTHTKKLTSINFEEKTRVYACAINPHQTIYFTWNDEIKKVHYPSVTDETLPIHFQENEVPISLTCTADDLLWIATNQSNIYVVKNDKIIDTLTDEIALLQNLTHITSNANQVVVSSKTGLAIIDYSFNSTLNYKVRFVNQQDGLPSSIINQTYIGNDSIYCATDNGIGVLSRNFIPKKYTISPTIQSIKIDNELLPLQNLYKLKSGTHSIQLQLSGIDLSGHLFAMQYSLNDTLHWNTIEGNQLSLILQGNETQIYIRTKDIQNQTGKPLLACTFNVAIPFYNTIWFWMLIVSAVFIFLFWLYYRLQQLKQKRNQAQQQMLERQRQNITADLHDEMGSALSSLQVNSAIANNFINKDVEKTKEVLAKIESQSQSISEKLGDMIWSMKPGKEEFLTFSNRIRNFANDLLGSTNIDYEINIEPQVDSLLSNIQVRKNVILILKEAINNAAKYSHATIINIDVSIQNEALFIVLHDNGIGFEPNQKGNGLNTMKTRAEEIGGTFSIHSIKQQGTEMKVQIPLPTIRDKKNMNS